MSNETVNRYVNIYIESGNAQRALDALIAKEKTLNLEIEQNSKSTNELKTELESLKKPIIDATNQFKKSESELKNLIQLQGDFRAAIEKNSEKSKFLKQELNGLREPLKNARTEYLQSEKQITSLTNKQIKLNEQISKNPKNVERLKQNLIDLLPKIDLAKEKFVHNSDVLNSLLSKNKQITQELKINISESERFKSSLQKLNDPIDTLKKNIVNTKNELNILNGRQNKTLETLNSNPSQRMELVRQLKELAQPIDVATKKLKGELTPSLVETQNSVRDVGRELSRMNKEDANYGKMVNLYKQGNEELELQKQKIGLIRGGLEKLWSQAKIVAAGVLVSDVVQGAFGAVIGGFRNMISNSAVLSDNLADLRRVAGLTANEAETLNKQLNSIDTRTSVRELRELAIMAGKLGVAKEDLLGFTEAVNKLTVALGDELGNASQITEQLGKILNVFDGKINSENITKLGNAFVELANSGVATGGYMADFDQRLSGIAKSAGISLGALTGLGAGMEEMGARVESSSTAINKILIKMASDLPAAAKAAGKDVKEFAKTYQQDATEAMLQFAEGLSKNAKSFPELTKAFDEADEKGVRVIETLAKLGQNTDMLRQRIKLGVAAIGEQNAINDAFALKNDTVAGSIEKIGKQFKALTENSTVLKYVKGLVDGFGNLLKWLIDLPNWIGKNKQILLLYTTAIIAFNAAKVAKWLLDMKDLLMIRLLYAEEKVGLLMTQGLTIAKTAYNVVVGLLTGNLKRASEAMAAFNAVSKANVLGVIITVVTTAISLFEIFRDKAGKVNAALERQLQINKEISELGKTANNTYADAISEMQVLRDRINDTNTKYADKEKILKRLIDINPEFAKTLSISKDGHLQGAKAIDIYIDALNRKALAEASEIKLKELYKTKIDADIKYAGDLTKAQNDYSKRVTGNTGWEDTNEGKRQKQAILKSSKQTLLKDVTSARTERDATYGVVNPGINTLNSMIKAQGDVSNVPIPGTRDIIIPPSSTGDKNNNKSTSKADRMEESLKKQAENWVAEVQKMYGDLSAAQMSEVDKEVMQDAEKYDKLLKNAAKFAKFLTAEEKKTMSEEALQKAKAESADLIRNKHHQKEISDAVRSEYEQALQASDDYWNDEAQKTSNAYADGQIKKEEYEKELNRIQLEQLQERERIANDYYLFDEKANKDSIRFHREAERGKTQITIEENEKRKAKASRENIAGAELGVINAAHGNTGEPVTKKHFDALQQYRKTQFEEEIKDLDKNSKEYQAKKAAFDEQNSNDKKKYVLGQISQDLQYAQAAFDIYKIFADAKTEQENRELEAEKSRNDKKKEMLDKRLSQGLISQQDHDRQVEKINKEQARKEHELAVKQFKRNQRMQIVQTIMSGAQSVIQMMATAPWPVNIVMAALAAAATIAQVATIAKQKPPEYARGGKLDGPGHESKYNGMPVKNPVTGNTEAYLEGGEGIVNKYTMGDRRRYTVSGTPSQITSLLNAYHGGVNWESGATMSPVWRLPTIIPFNYTKIRKAYATGGVYGNDLINQAQGDNTGSNAKMSISNKQNEAMVQTQAALAARIEQLGYVLSDLQKNGIPAYTLLSDQERQADRLKKIKDEATMR